MMCKGFLLGGTAGRTTLNGEGLQHQDGHSHILASTVPSLLSYDPAFGYEVAVIVREGMRRMYEEQEDIFYYLTLYNENHLMPDMAEVLAATGQTQEVLVQGILQGGYCFSRPDKPSQKEAQIHLLASGSIMQQVIAAATQLESMGFKVATWSMTSFVELQRQAMAVDRNNRDATAKNQQDSNLQRMFAGQSGAFVAVTDYMASLALGIAAWMPDGYEVLGTDGFGLSESRSALRAHFEVDAKAIVRTSLTNLHRQALISDKALSKHLRTLTE